MSVKWLFTTLWYFFAVCLVLMVATFGAARLLLPTANQYTEKVEQEIYDVLGQPVKIASLDAEWRGFTPTLILKDVEVYLKDKSKVVMRFPNIRIGLDIYHSITTANLRFSNFDLVATNMFIERDGSGDIHIVGLAVDHNTDTGLDDEILKRWILTQSKLNIELRNLVYIDKSTKQAVFNLSNVKLQLRNRGERHIVDAVVTLAGKSANQKEKELLITIDSTGDLLSTTSWTGEIYGRAKSLSMDDMVNTRQLLNNRVQFTNSDNEIWIDIRDSTIRKVQANLSFKDLVYFPELINAKKRKPLHYESLSGKFLWRQNDVRWNFNARDFEYVTNAKRGPKASLSVVYNRSSLNSINISADYLKIEDVVAAAKAFHTIDNDNKVLSRVFAAKLLGTVRNLSLSTTLEDSPKIRANGIVENLSGSFGGGAVKIAGLSGKIQANDNTRSMLVQSNDLTIDIPGIFNNKLGLGVVSANVSWAIDETDVNFQAKEISILNPDASLGGDFSLDWPLDERAAMVDMRVDIKSGEGGRIYKYLPHKFLSQNTNAW